MDAFAFIWRMISQIIAYTAGKTRRSRVRSVVGDRVQVEMTPYDADKGRIIFRERTPVPGQRSAAPQVALINGSRDNAFRAR